MLQSTGGARGTGVTMCEFWLFLSFLLHLPNTLGQVQEVATLRKEAKPLKCRWRGKSWLVISWWDKSEKGRLDLADPKP